VEQELALVCTENASPTHLCLAALLCTYLERSLGIGSAETALDYLNRAASSASQEKQSIALFGGLAGIGWMHGHVMRVNCFADSDDAANSILAPIDERILFQLRVARWVGPYNLTQGLVGIGIYWLERLPSPAALEGLSLVVSHLAKLSHESWGGLSWIKHGTNSTIMESLGAYDLSLTSGTVGVLRFLAHLVALNICRERALVLLEGGLFWLSVTQRPPTLASRFGAWFSASEQLTDNYLALAYGDLATISSLLQIGHLLQRDSLAAFAIECLHVLRNKLPAPTEVTDITLCHGVLGIAHVFNRCYHSDGDARLRVEARRWYTRALAMLTEGDNSGVRRDLARCSVRLQPELLLCSGGVGIALTLLASISQTEPLWDRMLLQSFSHQTPDLDVP